MPKSISKYIDIEADTDSSLTATPPQHDIIHDQPTTNWQSVVHKMEEKYKNIEEEEVEEKEEEKESDFQLPNYKCPKLWLVRVKGGKEKSVYMRLINEVKKGKAEVETNRNTDTDTYDKNIQNTNPSDKNIPNNIPFPNTITSINTIYSIIHKETLPGYIYIESHYRQPVLNLISSYKFIKKNVSVVPLNEMVDIFSFKKKVDVNTFVEIKRGRRRGERGIVVGVIGDEVVRVKLLRNEEKSINSYSESNFIVKKLRTSDLKPVQPTLKDLSIFNSKPNIKKGDTVQVKKGELKTLTGQIKEVNSDSILLHSKKGNYYVNVNDVERKYSLGDEVNVKNEGNGVIVHLEEECAIISFDFKREIKVKVSELNEIKREYKIRMNEERRRNKRDYLYNKKVNVTRGDMKGYMGIVKEVFRDRCVVEMVCNLRRVEVGKEDVMVYEEGGKSPYKSPYRGYRSPYRVIGKESKEIREIKEMKTPGYKEMKTPGYKEMKTPSFKDSYKTPSYKTPSYKEMRTPSYKDNYKTPSYKDSYKTPSYKESSYKTLSYKDSYKTPSFKEMKTPSFKDSYKTPSFKDSYKTPSYNDNYNPHILDTYKTPTTDKTTYDKTTFDKNTYEDDSPYKNTQLLLNNQPVTVTDINFDEGIVILKNNQRVEIEKCGFIQPEQFGKCVVMGGRDKGVVGMLVRVVGVKGTVRCARLGAVEVELGMLTRIE